MRKIALIFALSLVPLVALAQFYLRPNVPPQTVIGNPNAVYAPAQAIPLQTLSTDIASGNLLTPVLPSSVDLTNLPPQTVIGNGTSSSAGLGFITFSQLETLSNQSGLPTQIYTTYDPTNVPAYTMIGNISTISPALVVPISLGNFFGGALLLEAGGSNFFLLEDNASHLCLVMTAC